MSRIWVDRIEAIARARIARTAQKAALPPQPQRLDANLWHLNRRPWMHARYPRMLGLSLGPDLPAKTVLEQNRDVQTHILERFTDYTLEQLLVMPELPSEIQLAIREQVIFYQPGQGTPQQTELYRPAGYSITAEAATPCETLTLNPSESRLYIGQSIPAPCILREIVLVAGSVNTNFPDVHESTFRVDGYGTIFTYRYSYPISNRALGNSGRGLDRWILGGSLTPIIEHRNPMVTPVTIEERESASLTIVCEPLIKL